MGDEVPEVVIMASKTPEEELVNLLSQRWATRANIKYLYGNPTDAKDLMRARITNVELCYVLGDVNASPQQEDLQNIVRAAAVYRLYQTQMLVMMLEAKNIRFAVQAGIPERMCAGLDDLEFASLASSCQCVGLSTLLINLALPDLGSHDADDLDPREMWMNEYPIDLWGTEAFIGYMCDEPPFHAGVYFYFISVLTGVMTKSCY